MASTYTSSLRTEQQATGENRSTWGTKANTVFQLLEDAIAGYVSVAMGNTNTTLSTANGATDQARNMVVELTGVHTNVRTLTIPAAEKIYLLKNSTTGGYSITVSNGTNTFSLGAGRSAWVWTDGTNINEVQYLSYGPQTLTVAQKAQTLENLAANVLPAHGRLTFTTGTPILSTDVSNGTTLYYTPFVGNKIALYNSTTAIWEQLTFTELSLSPTLAETTVYDVFCYNNAGTATLETLAWSGIATRATALTTQNGVYVKSGDATRRYLGTVYAETNGISAGAFDFRFGGSDSNALISIWNMYNRVPVRGAQTQSTGSHTYTTASNRLMNNNITGSLIQFVAGLSGLCADASLSARITAAASGGFGTIGIGIGNGGSSSTTLQSRALARVSGGVCDSNVTALYRGVMTSVGLRELTAIELGDGTNANTFYGSTGMSFNYSWEY